MMPLLAAMLLGSCRGDDGPMGPTGPMGPAGMDGESFCSFEHTFEVFQNDWEAVTNLPEPYFKYSFDLPEMTNEVINNHGTITVYRVLNDGYFGVLPAVRLCNGKDKEGNTVNYTQVVDFEFANGVINFYVTNSDFYMDEKPDAMKFKVVVHYY